MLLLHRGVTYTFKKKKLWYFSLICLLWRALKNWVTSQYTFSTGDLKKTDLLSENFLTFDGQSMGRSSMLVSFKNLPPNLTLQDRYSYMIPALIIKRKEWYLLRARRLGCGRGQGRITTGVASSIVQHQYERNDLGGRTFLYIWSYRKTAR